MHNAYNPLIDFDSFLGVNPRAHPFSFVHSLEAPASGGGVRSQGAQGDGKSPASGGGQSHRPRTERSEFTQPFIRLVSFLETIFLHLTRPSRHSIVLSTVTDLTRSKADLVAENALLRQQLIVLHRQVKKPSFSQSDRLWLVLLASRVKNWKAERIREEVLPLNAVENSVRVFDSAYKVSTPMFPHFPLKVRLGLRYANQGERFFPLPNKYPMT